MVHLQPLSTFAEKQKDFFQFYQQINFPRRLHIHFERTKPVHEMYERVKTAVQKSHSIHRIKSVNLFSLPSKYHLRNGERCSTGGQISFRFNSADVEVIDFVKNTRPV